MRSLDIRLTLLILLTLALVACGGPSEQSPVTLAGPPAPAFDLVGVAPNDAGAIEISNASRAGAVTVLYFSFVG